MERLILLASPFAYSLFRLRYIILQRILLLFTRYAEWISFQNLIPARFFILYIAFRYGVEFLVRYRWSSLEDLRGDLARLHHNRQHREYQLRIRKAWNHSWFGLLILATLSLSVTWAILQSIGNGFPIFFAVILFMGLIGLYTDWILKTLQSILFSVARTQRPLWSLSGLDVLHVILLIFVARPYGIPGMITTFLINTILRIVLSITFTLRTARSVGIPSLGTPRLSQIDFVFQWKNIKTGMVLPLIELPFVISILFYHLALNQWDRNDDYESLIFILSPIYLFAPGIGQLYYVDLLKFKDRVFQRAFQILTADAIRAAFLYSVFISGLGFLVIRILQFQGITLFDFLVVGLLFLSWSIYFAGTLCAFVQGSRWSLITLSIFNLVFLGITWDLPSLIGFSLVVPASFGVLGIRLSRKSQNEVPIQSQWVSRSAFSSEMLIQGVTLRRGTLGFSLQNAVESLFSALPAGALIGLENRRTLIWSTPQNKRLDIPKILDIFGVYWDEEIHSRSVIVSKSELPIGAVLWKLGTPVPFLSKKSDPSELHQIYSMMKQKVRGRSYSPRFVSIGFRPIFENGVWTGGHVWRKNRKPKP